jgi:hypothetical protein
MQTKCHRMLAAKASRGTASAPAIGASSGYRLRSLPAIRLDRP